MPNNFSIITLGIIIPAFSVFGFKLLVFLQTYHVLGALVVMPVCILLLATFIDLNLSIRNTLYLFAMHACVYLYMAQLPREYLHIYSFSLLGAHIQKKFPKLLAINLLCGVLVSFLDEYIQLHVPSRFFDPKDIFLNYASFLTGLIILKVRDNSIILNIYRHIVSR